MRRATVALLLLAGCGGAARTTGLTITLDYDQPLVDVLVSGTADVSGRDFGPFDVSGDALQPGATVGLLFDADDAGPVDLCASWDAENGDRGQDCASYELVAGRVGDGSLRLGDGSR